MVSLPLQNKLFSVTLALASLLGANYLSSVESLKIPVWCGLPVGLIIAVSLVIFGLQALITSIGTSAQIWSVEAYVQNLLYAAFIYRFIFTWNPIWLLVPPGFKAFLCVKGIMHWGKNLTTAYLYSDYFENYRQGWWEDDCTYYTEGDFSGTLPYDTLDHSEKNVDAVQAWARAGMKNMVMNGATLDGPKCMSKDNPCFSGEMITLSQKQKYEWIAKHLNITKESRVLEIGFGRLDLMLYMRDVVGASVEGLNISTEQIARAKANGFTCHLRNIVDMKGNTADMGQFDAIITNGCFEYVGYFGADLDKMYHDIAKNAFYPLLKPGGLWYSATVHFNECPKGNILPVFYIKRGVDVLRNLFGYIILGLGNEGAYPKAPSRLTDAVNRAGMTTKLQQNRTLDYLLYSYTILAVIDERLKKARIPLYKSMMAWVHHLCCFLAAPYYLESYLCYTHDILYPFGITFDDWNPWCWQFLKQRDGYTPVTHYWLIFEKPKQ